MQRAALITGSAKRIGRAIAEALARDGFDIAVHYHRSADAAEQLAADLRALGRNARTYRADLADASQLAPLVAKAFGDLPHLNLLVNNASIFERASLKETDEDLFNRHFAINLKAPFFLARAFAARCRSGHVVNLLDTRIAQVFTPYFAYALTKKALADFTRMAARALAPGIRVNGVCPGLILPAAGEADDALEKLAPRVPLQRTGSCEDVAEAVLFLVRNDYLTGQLIYVDGGEHLT